MNSEQHVLAPNLSNGGQFIFECRFEAGLLPYCFWAISYGLFIYEHKNVDFRQLILGLEIYMMVEAIIRTYLSEEYLTLHMKYISK